MNSFLFNSLCSFSLLLFLCCLCFVVLRWCWCFASMLLFHPLVLLLHIGVATLHIGAIIFHVVIDVLHSWCCFVALRHLLAQTLLLLFSCWCYCFTLVSVLFPLVSLVLPPSCPMQVGAWNTKLSTNHEVNFFPFFCFSFF
jgi:hypothetical protein